MGGEKTSASVLSNSGRGSPPRGRGKGGRLYGKVAGGGITPAWAGKRGGGPIVRNGVRDHPRVGGEKLSTLMLGTSSLGSPPRGRGKVVNCDGMGSNKGITPAWAGKSC